MIDLSAAPTQATVLIATLDEATRVFSADGLRADGYDVHAAASTADAQLWLHTRQPDLLILDAGLQRGYALPRSFLAPAVPLLLLTGSEDVPADAVLGRQVTRMRKPFEWLELRRQMTLLLLAAAGEDARARLPRLLRLRDDQELVLVDRLAERTVLLAYDNAGSGAHWVGVDQLATEYRSVGRPVGAAAP